MHDMMPVGRPKETLTCQPAHCIDHRVRFANVDVVQPAVGGSGAARPRVRVAGVGGPVGTVNSGMKSVRQRADRQRVRHRADADRAAEQPAERRAR